MPPKKADDPLMTLLEQGVRDVLKSERSTPAQRLQAISAGAKLLAVKHKISGDDDGTGSFFDNG